MSRTHSLRLLLLLPAILMGGCADGAPPQADGAPGGAPVQASAGYGEMSVAELQGRMEGKDFPLINVHVPFEGDLPGTDDSIPFDQITAHLDRLPADKDATIVLYCRTGRMSMEAAEVLAGLGYTSVYNLTGGFLEWTAAGFPMAGG
jgi:rhodanese-related sulfurtransferase